MEWYFGKSSINQTFTNRRLIMKKYVINPLKSNRSHSDSRADGKLHVGIDFHNRSRFPSVGIIHSRRIPSLGNLHPGNLRRETFTPETFAGV